MRSKNCRKWPSLVMNYGTMPKFQRMSNRKDHSKRELPRNVGQKTIQWPNFDLKKTFFFFLIFGIGIHQPDNAVQSIAI